MGLKKEFKMALTESSLSSLREDTLFLSSCIRTFLESSRAKALLLGSVVSRSTKK